MSARLGFVSDADRLSALRNVQVSHPLFFQLLEILDGDIQQLIISAEIHSRAEDGGEETAGSRLRFNSVKKQEAATGNSVPQSNDSSVKGWPFLEGKMLLWPYMQGPARITLLIADDHAIVREGLRALLQTDSRMTIVAEAVDGKQALELASRLKPQIILMDIFLPVINGIEATREITRKIPTSKVLIFSTASDSANVEAALQCGASGFLTKASPSREIFAGIGHAVSNSSKDPFLCSAVQHQEAAVQASKKHLSPRESQVLYLIAQGYSNKCIGPELGISMKTVEKHRDSLMKKLNIHTTAGLTSYAIAQGVLQLDLAHTAERR